MNNKELMIKSLSFADLEGSTEQQLLGIIDAFIRLGIPQKEGFEQFLLGLEAFDLGNNSGEVQ